MQKLMILGAGVYQLPLIEKAKEMGFFTIIVSRDGNYPGIKLADLFLDIDTTDVASVLNAARENAISGILTTGTDVCLPALGKVNDELGLSGPGFEAALKSTDKVLMKRFFEDFSVPTARYKMFNIQQEALEYANTLGYPVMVKATDSSGSRGITKVNNLNEFDFAWNRALSVSRSGEIIVEEYLEGVEFGAQAIIHENKVVAVFAHGDMVTNAPFFTPFGHSMPSSLTDEQLKQTKQVIEKAVHALGIKDCISNVDLMLVENEVKIIEIGARMGATCLPENISIYTGTNAYEHLIQLAIGNHPEITIKSKQPNASLLMRSPKTGTIRNIILPESVRTHTSLFDLKFDVQIGDKVNEFKVGPDRIGHIIVISDDALRAEKLALDLASKIQIIID